MKSQTMEGVGLVIFATDEGKFLTRAIKQIMYHLR